MGRLFCRECFSVLATLPLEGPKSNSVLLCLGCVDDRSIPKGLSLKWQEDFDEWAPASKASWWTAVPTKRGGPRTRTLKGSCACGNCAFTAIPGSEFQTQHCYCNLCRRLS